MADQENETILTWGEIARFFGRSMATVRRWAKVHDDFPVRREFDRPRAPVWSTRSDLERWATRHRIPKVGDQQ